MAKTIKTVVTLLQDDAGYWLFIKTNCRSAMVSLDIGGPLTKSILQEWAAEQFASVNPQSSPGKAHA